MNLYHVDPFDLNSSPGYSITKPSSTKVAILISGSGLSAVAVFFVGATFSGMTEVERTPVASTPPPFCLMYAWSY